MAKLERLTIRGIRNFGADAGDEQRITFSAPLTLVLGANGCGKTTIIECIKYALTGETPPNCREGKNFINNPDVSNLTEALGQVKLQIKSVNGTRITICRSAKVSKKGQKYQFKTLDATLTFEPLDGKEVNVSKRNADATNDMCDAVGVSKAVINDVLFCHQEDANWPLSSDQELMNKFDKIFGTSEYNNALDRMRTMRKQCEAEIKDKKVTLKELEMVKQETDRMQLEIEKHQQEKIEFDKEIKECDEKIVPLKVKFEEIKETEKQFDNITKTIAQYETELRNAEKNSTKMMQRIVEVFQGSKAELIAKLDDLTDGHLVMSTELTEREDQLGLALRTETDTNKQEIDLQGKFAALAKDCEHEQDLYSKRAKLIKKLCTDLNIELNFDVENDNNRAFGLISSIKEKCEAEKNRIANMVKDYEKVDAEQEQVIRGFCEEEVRINSENRSIESQLIELGEELKKQKDSMDNIEKGRESLREITRTSASLKSALEGIEKDTQVPELEVELAADVAERDKLKEEVENLDEQIQGLNTFTTIMADVKGKEQHVTTRKADERRIRNKHCESLKKIFPDDEINSNFKRRVESEGQKLRSESNRLEAIHKRRESQALTLKNNLRNKKQQKADAEAERIRLDNEIEHLIENESFEAALADAREETDKFKMEYSSLKSSEMFYKKYIKKVEDQPCCPLCHKDLNRNEISGLKDELHHEITKLPENIKNAESQHKVWSSKLEKLFSLKPKVERLDEIRCKVIPLYDAECEDIEAKLKTAQDDLKENEKEAQVPKEKYELITEMLGDMGLLDDIIQEIERIQNEINVLREKLPEDQGNIDVDELQQNRKTKYERVKELDVTIARNQKRIRDNTEKMNKIRNRLLELREKEIQLKGDTQNLPAMKERFEELKVKNREMEHKKVNNIQALEPIKVKIRETETKRQQLKIMNAAMIRKENERFDRIKQSYNSMNGTTKDLEQSVAKNLQLELGRVRTQIQNLKQKKTEASNAVQSIQNEIKDYTKRIAEHEKVERNLKDNLELMGIREEVEKAQRLLQKFKDDERQMNTEELLKKKVDLQQQWEQLIKIKSGHGGRIAEKNRAIDGLQKTLGIQKYKDSKLNYQKALYDNVVSTKIVEDLLTYCDVLERALNQFHSEKMARINRLIRDLWRDIYKGNDIDCIQINTEEVKGTVKRRSYTYRVVALKNDSYMDFRGQSSAGQRVLACLIIRIALAETFGATCGVLALDEPTTNLDRVNIESLCHALNRLIEQREIQTNFMLIVITHDKEFIETMDQVSSYWNVTRDVTGKSRIEKKRV